MLAHALLYCVRQTSGSAFEKSLEILVAVGVLIEGTPEAVSPPLGPGDDGIEGVADLDGHRPSVLGDTGGEQIETSFAAQGLDAEAAQELVPVTTAPQRIAASDGQGSLQLRLGPGNGVPNGSFERVHGRSDRFLP